MTTDFKSKVYDGYFSTSYSRRNDLTEEGRKKAIRAYAREFGPFLPEDKAAPILEIGCGGGAFLLACRELGHSSIRGLDISQDQVAFCHSQGLEDVICADGREYLGRETGPYALVVLSDVLEHLPKAEGLELMGAIYRRLASPGRVVVRVPNMSNPLNLQARYGDFTHEVGFSKESLEQMLRICGFEVERVDGAYSRHPRWLMHTVFDVLLWKAFVLFYRRTMQVKAKVVRGKNLIGVGLKP